MLRWLLVFIAGGLFLTGQAAAQDLSGYCLDNGAAGCQNRFIQFNRNSIDFCEETCSFENPVSVKGLDATLYDFVCLSDQTSQLSGRVMLIRQTGYDGTRTMSLVTAAETRAIVPCP